ncbi:hypothetical protein [Hymenobacter sp. AT01-02]|uniref:hypothetical protein n=1 Tax=Hymenobacter sp. AT01-02 TaxID=1571877 RepID=UPI0005F270A0|nr:hypothetical protein [Hymenobacter sp. AT01-02]
MSRFATSKYDYWPIYEHLKKYYPLGITIQYDDMAELWSYPGYKELGTQIVTAIQDEAQYAKWTRFTAQIADTVGLPSMSTTYGQHPCYSAILKIDEVAVGNRLLVKELFFAVSVVGPFYTVLGQDQVVTTLVDQPVRSTSYLTLSPQDEYKEAFEATCQAIEQYFTGYRFVPFSIATRRLQGLYYGVNESDHNPIFYGLFNDQVDIHAATVGSRSYKNEDWIRNDWKDDGGRWEIYPPMM